MYSAHFPTPVASIAVYGVRSRAGPSSVSQVASERAARKALQAKCRERLEREDFHEEKVRAQQGRAWGGVFRTWLLKLTSRVSHSIRFD